MTDASKPELNFASDNWRNDYSTHTANGGRRPTSAKSIKLRHKIKPLDSPGSSQRSINSHLVYFILFSIFESLLTNKGGVNIMLSLSIDLYLITYLFLALKWLK